MKKILIPMLETGGGHKAVAMAIRDAIEKEFPSVYQIDIVNLPIVCGATHTDKWVRVFWNAALDKPIITSKLNEWMDNLHALIKSDRITRVFFKSFMLKGMRYIRDYQADLIISTHYICTSVAGFARKKHQLNYKLINAVCDPFTVHCLWVNLLADEVAVFSDRAKNHMALLGQPANSMTILPFPLSQKYLIDPNQTESNMDKRSIRESLLLNTKMFTVLTSSGGEGIGNTSSYIRNLYLKDLPIQILVVCGRNEKLVKEMELLSNRESKAVLKVYGFVDNMDKLIMASDIALAKAGPSSLLEILVMGCPVMISHIAHMGEKGNYDFVIDEGFGWDVRNTEDFEFVITHMLQPGFLEPVREKIKNNQYLHQVRTASSKLANFMVASFQNE